MASSSSLVSEEQFLCPICLEVFTRPVSTPCGHNFCMSCISFYWDNETVTQCPICKECFQIRPDLKVNTFISELASHFKSLHVTDVDIQSTNQQPACSGSGVLCDICTDNKRDAVKSCLECLCSYCDVHLKLHCQASVMKRHTLVEPQESLEDRVCKKHNRLLELFCRDDKSVLCIVCTRSHNMKHDVVPVQRAYDTMKDLLGKVEGKVQQMIQERFKKVQSTRESVTQSKTETEKVIAISVQDLVALEFEIKKSQVMLIRVAEEKQKSAEELAEGFIGDMKGEISELQVAAAKLSELKEMKDQHRFLQSYPNSPFLPHMMDLSTFSFNRHLEIQQLRKSLRKSFSQLQMLLNEINTEINKFSNSTDVSNDTVLRHMQQFEVNIVLDPNTAHPLLSLSADGKQVRYNMGAGLWVNQILKPNMFTEHLAVLGQRGFSTSKFYFEVYVGDKTEWCLGVATASVQRRGAIVRTSRCGLWAIWFLEDKFETFCSPDVSVHVGKVEKVGVFVDYDGGKISFWDVVSAAQIYSFTQCFFTEELYPYFNPCDNEYGSNLEPMTIVPVCRTE
ncbi:E3 ubiquitin-protein ligase TRIM50-like [Melanotaenia boesemani]|uniref:E3 ubiquitin-protein ligase TRIM50-like n=1 Tax=Melanotaenia boesemani TaxID=1250792 RepID=UPI001C04CE13|nr:E3 ubiquitin-protein ligase TRIM50-like [Melanotaenia boesemani]